VEGLTSNLYHEHKVHIARYREAIDYLRDVAVSPDDSVIASMRFERCFNAKLLRRYDLARKLLLMPVTVSPQVPLEI
jgi:hypothetical protein